MKKGLILAGAAFILLATGCATQGSASDYGTNAACCPTPQCGSCAPSCKGCSSCKSACDTCNTCNTCDTCDTCAPVCKTKRVYRKKCRTCG